MDPFKNVKSIVTPFDKVNVDTDQIVPKQFLKLVQKSGFGKFLFFNWRYDEQENEKSDFVLNDTKYSGAQILLTRRNFGCGSSREHAPWALEDYGFRAIIAPSFADIFYNNCFKNGILPITLSSEIVDSLFNYSGQISIDLSQQIVKTNNHSYNFEVDPERKRRLLNGLDDIGLTLQNETEIRSFEKEHFAKFPWL